MRGETTQALGVIPRNHLSHYPTTATHTEQRRIAEQSFGAKHKLNPAEVYRSLRKGRRPGGGWLIKRIRNEAGSLYRMLQHLLNRHRYPPLFAQDIEEKANTFERGEHFNPPGQIRERTGDQAHDVAFFGRGVPGGPRLSAPLFDQFHDASRQGRRVVLTKAHYATDAQRAANGAPLRWVRKGAHKNITWEERLKLFAKASLASARAADFRREHSEALMKEIVLCKALRIQF